ncbi:MAG: hypothetical protein IKO64_06180 [Kiritimatiellae bacterium]|nr:hypothetical protein [Kiritimatiellia bacterium]
MTTDYIVASLPGLAFGEPAPMTWAAFEAVAGKDAIPAEWQDLETQLRNAMAEARGGGDKFRRPAEGVSLYWRGRVLAAFQEKDPLKRDELLDRVWWDAAGELTPCASPLGKGALGTYAVRLKVALKRQLIDAGKGGESFERLAQETQIQL